MPSLTMVSRLLDAADTLMKEGRRSTAFRRRAVSTAYYAVFHAISKLCADSLLPSAKRDADEYVRTYRALDHGPMKNAFEQDPLKEHKTLRKVGLEFVELYDARQRADYFPPVVGVFSPKEAQELIERARHTVAELETLNESDRLTLATCLLFAKRRR